MHPKDAQSTLIRIGIFSASGRLVAEIMGMIKRLAAALFRTGLYGDMIPDPKNEQCDGWQKANASELTIYREPTEANMLIKEPQLQLLSVI